MPAERSRRRAEEPLDGLVESLTREQLIEVVLGAADLDDGLARRVRLVACREKGELGVLRKEVDRALRTRRFLGYGESMDWARAAGPVVAELERATKAAPSRELVELLQRALGHVVKVIHHADDSSGLIGDLARQLLDLHACACDTGVADPVKLAAWMIRFRFEDQDFFEPDPVRYADALGDVGIAAYRRAVDAADDVDSFAVRYARERLAVLDQDLEAIIRIHGGDLSSAHQFIHVAEAMAELGRDDLVLEWTSRGIAETGGWQVSRLYDLACAAHTRSGRPLEVLRLRRSQHERMPSASTYSALRKAAEEVEAWEVERAGARAALEKNDIRGFIDALLADGDRDLAWGAAVAAQPEELDSRQWLRLAESREVEHPADALAVYRRVADEILVTADRRAYQNGVRILKKAARAADTAGLRGDFSGHVSRLREQHRRRPTLIAMLDNARLA